ncbi:uncharacterized protein LOC5519209 [Nematostella vectensis]|uniref:uncharacterized protein LOC5519209 n=1 Tax=Nematostella vectensis TaxID=45351 RepID=UPI002076E8A8|nr:uncharacterized protein LOC5519209 [Nematostella vectensis]
MLLVHKVVVLFSSVTVISVIATDPCFESRYLQAVPKDHLFHTKTKPLVIGHRGNPVRYQENTLEGFTSLLGTNADGFELDIYLTKDEELVCFHDDNTKFLTGEEHVMWETNAEDLTKVYTLQSFNFSGKVYKFDKKRPLPMLKDVLTKMKDTGKLMYLEMKPSRLRNMTESNKVGKAVAKLVTEMGLVKQAMLNSFDPFKTLAAKRENPDIPIGFFYYSSYWNPSTAKVLRDTIRQLPGMASCVDTSPSGVDFIHKMFQSGAAAKSINASFLDMDYKIYDDPRYSNDTFQTLRGNYSASISAGAWTLYSMKNSDEQDKIQDVLIDRLVRQGAERLITDDVYRMLKKLGRPQTPPISAANYGRVSLSGILLLLFLSFVIYL